MTTTAYTNGVTLTDAAAFNDYDTASYSGLGTIAGTNTITAVGPASATAYATNQIFRFIPANTNTGATTLNITCNSVALGAKNVFRNGAACVGGEIRQSIPVFVMYDGTQFHIIANGFSEPFLDTHPMVQGSADGTKKVRFEVDGLTTATTRVITMPDADVTLGLGAATGVGTTFLGADVLLNNTGSFFDGPSTGSIGASGQVWLIMGRAVMSDSAGTASLEARLYDGTTVHDDVCVTNQAQFNKAVVTLCKVITLSAATTFKVQAKDSSSTSGTLFTTGSAGTANLATSITAVRLV